MYTTVKRNDKRDLFLSEMELVQQQMVYSHKCACSQFGFSNTVLRQDLKYFTEIDKLRNVLPARFKISEAQSTLTHRILRKRLEYKDFN